MKNPVVAIGHVILRNRFAYDFYQSAVGGVAYRDRLIAREYDDILSNILDLGCGTGAILPLVSEKTNYIGVDMSGEYLEKARSRRPSCLLYEADVTSLSWVKELSLEGDSLATALGLFHHLDDSQVKALLANCLQVLPSGSTLFSVDPAISSKTGAVARWFANNDRGQFVRSPEELGELVENGGFKVEVMSQTKQFRIPLDTVEIRAKKP